MEASKYAQRRRNLAPIAYSERKKAQSKKVIKPIRGSESFVASVSSLVSGVANPANDSSLDASQQLTMTDEQEHLEERYHHVSPQAPQQQDHQITDPSAGQSTGRSCCIVSSTALNSALNRAFRQPLNLAPNTFAKKCGKLSRKIEIKNKYIS